EVVGDALDRTWLVGEPIDCEERWFGPVAHVNYAERGPWSPLHVDGRVDLVAPDRVLVGNDHLSILKPEVIGAPLHKVRAIAAYDVIDVKQRSRGRRIPEIRGRRPRHHDHHARVGIRLDLRLARARNSGKYPDDARVSRTGHVDDREPGGDIVR